jgi:hypothetical protein
VEGKGKIRLQDSGFGERKASSLQQTADSERRGIRDSGFGLRDEEVQGFKGTGVLEIVEGEFPVTFDPVRQAHDTALPRWGEEN